MKRTLKISSLLLVVVMLFCSCSSKKDVALKIGNAEIGNDVYAYFLDYVIINENKDDKMTQAQIEKRATELCTEYAKINTKFSEMKLSLSSSKKATIADTVTNKWSVFSGYYKSIGVTKQTLTKIEENAAYKQQLLLAIYDTNGTNPVDEETIKTYFKDNYIFFKAISNYLKTTDNSGKEVSLSADKIEGIKQSFNTMVGQVSAENTIDSVNLAYAQSLGETATSDLPISVIDKQSTAYPSGFFAKALEITAGQVKVLTFDDYIFLVQRIDNFDESQNFYTTYRTACLKALVNDDFANTVKSWYKDAKFEPNNKNQDKCYELIMDVRSKN